MDEKRRTPDWALDSFERLLDHAEGAARLLELSMRGISVLRAMPQALQAIDEARPPSDIKGAEARLQAAQRRAEFAEAEVDAGFPLLHAHAAISLWGDLENALRTFLASWLMNEPNARNVEPLRRLKVCLGEYESMDPEERCYYIVDRLEQELESRNRRGVDRFESLLEPFGLAGPLDKNLKRELLELYHVRNVLVHRRGLADRKLVQACPWLHLSSGEQVIITHECYLKYHRAVAAYVVELTVRVAARFGFSRSELIHEPAHSAHPA
jgi:hypothetical protein